MDSRRQRIAILAVVVLVLTAGIAIAVHINGTVPISDGVTLQAPDGMAVNVTGSTDALLEEPFTTSGTVYVITEAGNASFFSSGSANVTVHKDELEGTWTNVTAVDADPNSITIDPDDKDSAIVAQEIDTFGYISGIGADDSTVDFVYSSSATGEVTVQGLAASTWYGAVDADTGALLDSAQSNGGGAVTFDALDSGSHDVVIQTGEAPTLSNQSPTGDLSSPPTQLQIDVNDTDFPADSVDVEFFLDGSSVGTDTVTSNGTASTAIANPTGGSHTWNASVDDSYGNTVSSADFTFNVPSNLTIREESPAHPLIENGSVDPIPVELTFYEDVEDAPFIVNRTVEDGEVDLTGLPTGSEFSISIKAPGYYNRTVRLESLYDQSTVFLINKDVTTVENRFVISDRTGNFPPESTEINIQAAVNESLYNTTGGFSWMAVSGDDLGADEAFTDDLIDEKRYRIVVENDQGDERILGAYTAETDGVINLNIGSVVVDPEADDVVGLNATWINETGAFPKVNVQYNDTSKNTTEIHLHIYEYQNETNELLANTTFTGPYGTFTTTETVGAGFANDTTWVVELTGVKSDGANIEFKRIIGPNVPVLGGLPSWLVTIIFGGVIFMTAGLFSQLNGDIGAVVVAAMGAMLFFLGLTPDYLGAGVVVLALIAAGLLFIRERNAGGL